MNKLIFLATALLIGAYIHNIVATQPITVEEPTPKVIYNYDLPEYVEFNGRYYVDGTIIANDGNEWGYSVDTITDAYGKVVDIYDGMPVRVFVATQYTDTLEDDVIVLMVWDIATAIYDDLYDSFSEVENWEVTRNGNNISIDVK